MARDSINKLKQNIPDAVVSDDKQISIVTVSGDISAGDVFTIQINEDEYTYTVEKFLSRNLCRDGKVMTSAAKTGKSGANNAFNGKDGSQQTDGWFANPVNSESIQNLGYEFQSPVCVTDIELWTPNSVARISNGIFEGSDDGVNWHKLEILDISGEGSRVNSYEFMMKEWLSVSNNWKKMDITLNNQRSYKFIRLTAKAGYTDTVGVVEMSCFSEAKPLPHMLLGQFAEMIRGGYKTELTNQVNLVIIGDSFRLQTFVEGSASMASKTIKEARSISAKSLNGSQATPVPTPYSIPVSNKNGDLDDWVSYKRTAVFDLVLDDALEIKIPCGFADIKQVDVWCEGLKLKRYLEYNGECGLINFGEPFNGKYVEVHVRG